MLGMGISLIKRCKFIWSAAPDEGGGTAGEPIGLLLILTKAA